MRPSLARFSLLVFGMLAGIFLNARPDCQAAQEPEAAQVVGNDAVVSYIRRDSKLLLDESDTAAAFGWESKVVADGDVLVFCRDGDQGLCLPVRLRDAVSFQVDDALFVDAEALAKPLRFQVTDFGGVVRLVAAPGNRTDDPPTSGYNAAWGAGRGFRVGQTLPDIPLVDLDGNEVRFSRYLGKQYIIYCWASW
jgi:hypothetical protein